MTPVLLAPLCKSVAHAGDHGGIGAVLGERRVCDLGQRAEGVGEQEAVPARQFRGLAQRELPDLEKKPPKPKFIPPEKKTGVPTASKKKPEPAPKPASKKRAKA